MERNQKTRKVLEINGVEGKSFVCIMRLDGSRNPYSLYSVWRQNGRHQKKLAEYGNFVSIIEHIRFICHSENWGFQD